MRTAYGFLIGILLLPVLIGVAAAPATVNAAVCPDPSACATGFSCQLNSGRWDCVQDCNAVDNESCEADEVVITAGKKLTFQRWVDGQVVPFVDNVIMPLLYALAFLIFLIGIVRFFFLGGDEGREKGKSLMIWGLVGLAVLFAVWGLVRVLLELIPGA